MNQRARSKERAEMAERHRFSVLLYRLKKEGLVEEKISSRGKILKLTGIGKNFLAKLLHVKRGEALPPKRYKKQESKELKIITFDIPERDRKKRRWLRGALFNLGFAMLQKSVWTGNAEIPEPFLNDLRVLRLLPHVEIFSVSKKGTLEKIE